MMLRILIFLCVALTLTSCQYDEVEISDIRKFRIDKVDNNRIHFSFDIKLRNPNNYALKVSSTDLVCELNGRNLGNLYLDEPVKVPAGNNDYISIHSSVKTEGAANNVLPILLGSLLNRAIDVRLTGEVKGGAFIFPKTIQIDHFERVDFEGGMLGI